MSRPETKEANNVARKLYEAAKDVTKDDFKDLVKNSEDYRELLGNQDMNYKEDILRLIISYYIDGSKDKSAAVDNLRKAIEEVDEGRFGKLVGKASDSKVQGIPRLVKTFAREILDNKDTASAILTRVENLSRRNSSRNSFIAAFGTHFSNPHIRQNFSPLHLAQSIASEVKELFESEQGSRANIRNVVTKTLSDLSIKIDDFNPKLSEFGLEEEESSVEKKGVLVSKFIGGMPNQFELACNNTSYSELFREDLYHKVLTELTDKENPLQNPLLTSDQQTRLGEFFVLTERIINATLTANSNENHMFEHFTDAMIFATELFLEGVREQITEKFPSPRASVAGASASSQPLLKKEEGMSRGGGNSSRLSSLFDKMSVGNKPSANNGNLVDE
jgi:hypothetical protein